MRTALAAVWLLASFGACPRRAAARACDPVVVVDGDPALAVPVRLALAARGVAPGSGTPCPAVQAHVHFLGAAVHVEVIDPEGRVSVRDVSDAAGAATLVDTWAHEDLVDALLAPPRRGVDVTLGAAGEASWAGDGSLWWGASIAGCGRLGPTCTGLELRTASDGGEHSQLGLEVYTDYPFRLGGLEVAPGLGLGIGWLRDRDGPMLPDDRVLGLANLHATASVRLAGRLRLVVSLAAEASALGASGEPNRFFRASLGLAYREDR